MRDRLLALLALLLLCAVLLDWLFPLPPSLFPPFSKVVYFRDGRVARVFLTPDDKLRIRVKVEKLPDHVKKAFIAAEDRWFYYHPGVNPLAVIRALADNIRAGRIVSGASTITMQIVRIAEPRPRTLLSKIKEALRALQLELHFNKDDLLEIYLNIAPFGGNIEGVAAASLAYFGITPDRLSLSQAATLAALPRMPSKLAPGRDVEALRRERDRVLRRMCRAGFINRQALLKALKDPVPSRRLPLPFLAPHASRWVAQSFPLRDNLRTTLDYHIQKAVEEITRSYHRSFLEERGIKNVSVVVIDARTMEIVALVGSQDFFSREGGQVLGFLAKRSPGSALKPFLYALAFEKGLINMQTLLMDVPVSFGSYSPRNYNDYYRGMVRAGRALALSLNVPAVLLLRKVGMDEFLWLLLRLGFELKDSSRYGLSLILGGCGVSLLELTSAYAVFPSMGLYRRPRILLDQPAAVPERIFSPGTCYMISQVLSDHSRPDMPSGWEGFSEGLRIAWKTGTSYGRKDAWAIGYTPRYVVGVWAGNFTGEGIAELAGAEVAAPLLFRLFQLLEGNRTPLWFRRPRDLIAVDVCALSGMLPGPHCPERKTALVLSKRVFTRRCTFHRSYPVDPVSGYRLCPELEAELAHQRRVFVVFPSRTVTWLLSRGIRVSLPPPLHPACQSAAAGPSPKVLSPTDGANFFLQQDLPPERQRIPLLASAAPDAERVYWFVDDRMVASSSPFRPFWLLPEPGGHTIYCVDSQGRTSRPVRIVIINSYENFGGER